MPFPERADSCLQNLYRYHAPKNASANDGRVLNDMKDGSRVTVARPNFCGSWSAIVRKHSGGKILTLEEQLTDPGAENVIALLKYIIWESSRWKSPVGKAVVKQLFYAGQQPLFENTKRFEAKKLFSSWN